MNNVLTFREPGKIHRDELALVSSSVEEILRLIGVENKNGTWTKVIPVCVGGVAVDVLVSFNPGGRLPSPYGLAAIPFINELGEMDMVQVKIALRDYHPDVLPDGGRHVSHCQTYRALQGHTGAPFILTADSIKQLGATDTDVFMPAALRAGFTIAKVLEGLVAPLDFVPVWGGDAHAEQSNLDSWYHEDFKYWLWHEFRKGYHEPWWEMFGGFYTSKGPSTSAGLHEKIQELGKRLGYAGVGVLIIAGHVTEYCDLQTILQALFLGYIAIVAYDGMAPFDYEGEATTFNDLYQLSLTQYAGKLFFASNETLREVNGIWSQAK